MELCENAFNGQIPEPFRNKIKDSIPIEVEVDGVKVTGQVVFLCFKGFILVLDMDSKYKKRVAYNLCVQLSPERSYYYNDKPTEYFYARSKSELEALYKRRLRDIAYEKFLVDHVQEIEELKKTHAAENSKRKADDEEILKITRASLRKKFNAGLATLEEHKAALQKNTDARKDLNKINSELCEKINSLFALYYPD